MSAVERDRAHVIRQTQEKQLRQREAAERLGIGVRQFKRLVRSWKQQGDADDGERQDRHRDRPNAAHRLRV